MASSLEFNKVIAGILTAGIIASAAGIFAGILYQPHHLEEHAFRIDLPDQPVDQAESEAPPPFAALLAAADPAAGATVSRQCAACHVFTEGGANGVGPALWGVVGRDIAAAPGFSYSAALQGLEGVWDFDALDGFLQAPRQYATGTNMSYAGLRDGQQRANLIAYMNTMSNAPLPLPEPDAVGDAAAAEDVPATEPVTETRDAPAAAEPAEVAQTEDAPAADAPAEVAEAADEPAANESSDPAEAAADPVASEAVEDATAADESVEPAEQAVAAVEAEAPAGDASADGAAAADPLVAMVAAADPAGGERVFRPCAACHTAVEGGGNRVGPALWGVYGRDVGSVDGFNYSAALKEIPGAWDVAKLDGYLADPRGFAPGNRMAFAGVRSADDRVALIAYLHALSSDPVPLDGE